MPRVEDGPYPPLSDYRRHWILAWNRHRLETHEITDRDLQGCAGLLQIS